MLRQAQHEEDFIAIGADAILYFPHPEPAEGRTVRVQAFVPPGLQYAMTNEPRSGWAASVVTFALLLIAAGFWFLQIYGVARPQARL
ncbi:MAG TPA: hypothetical protein VIY09_08845, partial [Rhizomicrobium sp.]